MAAADATGITLYQASLRTYQLLRYGVSVQVAAGQPHETVHLVDWEHPENNDFALAEEVTLRGGYERRPDIVLYLNGIAVGVIELKRSSVEIADGVRQLITNQEEIFNLGFFPTVQLVFAGNDSQGLRYGTATSRAEFFVEWKSADTSPLTPGALLDRPLAEMCGKSRLLDLIRNFIIFDAGHKKVPRPHQFFGVKAAQEHLQGVTRTDLQSHIDALVAKGYGKTVTQHARWNLNAIFRLAKADGLMQTNPAEDLAVDRDAIARTPRRGATIGLEQFQQLVAVLELRDRLVVELVAIVGLRPGEAAAVRWTDINFREESVTVRQRVYRGKINTPKTANSSRVAALPSGVLGRLRQWRQMAEQPEGLVFPSENGKPLWVCNVLVRSLKPKARKLGFGEVNFQVLRRFQTSEGRRAGIDDKVAADQRGHTVGVALSTYTRTAVEQKRRAVEALESRLYPVSEALEATA
jgi:integrase